MKKIIGKVILGGVIAGAGYVVYKIGQIALGAIYSYNGLISTVGEEQAKDFMLNTVKIGYDQTWGGIIGKSKKSKEKGA